MATKVVNQETTTYSWDFRSKLLKVDFPSGDDPVMRYDGEGTRAKKVVGGATTVFLYDVNAGLPALLFETDGSLNEAAEYRCDLGGALMAMQRSSTLYWYHFDHLGSTRALTNTSETLTDTYKYDAWGNVTASSGSTATPFRFAGKLGYYDDGDVGLMLLGARWYDSPLGRFASRDPVAGSAPLEYRYCEERPLVLTDATGLWPRWTRWCLRWPAWAYLGPGGVVVYLGIQGGWFIYQLIQAGRPGRGNWKRRRECAQNENYVPTNGTVAVIQIVPPDPDIPEGVVLCRYNSDDVLEFYDPGPAPGDPWHPVYGSTRFFGPGA